MTRVLILGANGQLARHTTPFFLEHADTHLTLYLRNAKRLKNPNPARARVAEGDVTDRDALIASCPAEPRCQQLNTSHNQKRITQCKSEN